jgi:hypothetical protein
MLVCNCGPAWAQQNLSSGTLSPFMLAAGETRYIRLATYDWNAMDNFQQTPKAFVCWNVIVDTVEASSTPIDSIAWSYCKAWGSAEGDTLAQRSATGVRRYAYNYTGGLALANLDHTFTWTHGGKYCMVINQDGVPYFWIDCAITNSNAAKAYRITITREQTGVKE